MHKTPLFDAHFAHSAVLEEEEGWLVPARFGDVATEVAAARAGAVVLDLSYVDVLSLEGEALQRWTNGMFTNNTKRLQPGGGNRHGMCDDRGRLQGLLDLYAVANDHYIAVLEGVTAEWFAERYKMFLILDDIEVDERPDGVSVLSVQGPAAGAVLQAAGLPAPTVDRAHAVDEGSRARVARRDRTGLGGFDLLVPQASVQAVWQRLIEAGAARAGTDALDALRVAAGRARWPQDGTSKTMIHELRLNTDICAFDKGCYVGQEVINRIDVKGAINKRLTGLVLQAPVPLGAPVTLDDKQVGTVTSQAEIDGRTVALGVLRKTAWEPGTTVQVGDTTGSVVELPLRG